MTVVQVEAPAVSEIPNRNGEGIMTALKVDNVIWQTTKNLRDWSNMRHPDKQVDMSVAVLSSFATFKKCGYAAVEVDAHGNLTWRATKKFLRTTRYKPDPMVTVDDELLDLTE
jgi:hypothetical protein